MKKKRCSWLDAWLAISPCRFYSISLLLYLKQHKAAIARDLLEVGAASLSEKQNGMTHSPGEFLSLSQQVKGGQSSSESSKATAIKRMEL